jgi:hypothetical protein
VSFVIPEIPYVVIPEIPYRGYGFPQSSALSPCF